MMLKTAGCAHRNCGAQEKVWLPYFYKGREGGSNTEHPYCAECGPVKNLSSERPRQIGYSINLIAKLGIRYKIGSSSGPLNGTRNATAESGRFLRNGQKSGEEALLGIAKKCLNVPERAIVELMTFIEKDGNRRCSYLPTWA